MTKDNTKKIAGAALIVMTAVIFSRLTGFIRDTLIPNLITDNPKYGPHFSDAYFGSFAITNAMYSMLIGGAISAALVPVLSGYIQRNEEKPGWKAVSVFTNVIFSIMIVFCVLGEIFAPQIAMLITPGYKGETFLLVVKLTRILFPSVCFMMLTGILNGILNSYRKFAVAAYGAVIYNTLIVISIVAFYKISIEAIAFGVLGSSVIYFLIQLVFTLKYMRYYRPSYDLKDEGFRKLFSLAVPSIIASSIIQVNVIVITRFMSTFDEGSLTAYRMADTIWQTPLGIFAQSIGIALLPTLAAKLAEGNYKDFNKLYNKGMKSILIVTIPSSIAFITLSKDIMKLLFKNNNAGNMNIINTSALILVFFGIALLAQSICNMTNRAFYSDNNTKTPMLIGGSTIIINLVLCYFLSKSSLGVAGISLSYALVSSINALLLIIFLNKRMKGLDFSDVKAFLIRLLPAVIALTIVLFVMAKISPIQHLNANLGGKTLQIIYFALEAAVGCVVYFGLALVFKVEEAQQFVISFTEKFRRMIKKGKKQTV